MQSHIFMCLEDNFGVLVHDPLTGACAAIDAPAEEPVRQALAETGWQLTHILVTHRHYDHIGGIAALKDDFGCEVVAPEKARGSVPGVDRYVRDGDTVDVGSLRAEVWETPGHCPDHISYWFEKERAIFVGDVLFAMGCGRVFDGAYVPMWQSLERIMALPAETSVFFGHEYTLANSRFALSVDADNAALKDRFAEVAAARARGAMTCPTTVGRERATNPFLRAVEPAMQIGLGMAGAAPSDVFRELRERKNRF